MPDRDPVEVEADALMSVIAAIISRRLDRQGGSVAEDAQEISDAVRDALRTSANRSGEAMREAAAEACYQRAKTIANLGAGQPYIAVVEAREVMARDLGDVIRALPVSDAPASPWRDMQSAPKDGTRIIALYPIFNKDNDTNNPDSFIPLLIHWNKLGWDTGYWMLHAEPLAWMAVPPFDLPAPPAKDEQA